jgi:hypothetical protein
MQQGFTRPRGDLTARKIKRQTAPLSWQLRNACRPSWIKGWIATHLIAPFANVWGVATMTARLDAVLIRADGMRIHYDALSYRVITDTGVAFLVDDWDNSVTDFTTMNFHGCGTGVAAENATDTALGTESTTALNPDSTRATGTRSQPTANQYRSVGTLTFDAGAAVTEHGLLSQSATGGGTLWDRSVFSAINVVSADSIQFTYTCTVSSGG